MRKRLRFIWFLLLPAYLPHQAKAKESDIALQLGFRTHLCEKRKNPNNFAFAFDWCVRP